MSDQGSAGCGCLLIVAVLIAGSFVVDFFTTSDSEAIEQAHELWQEGQKANTEAITIYAKKIDDGTAVDDARTLKRTIEFYYGIGDQKQVNHFCELAVKSGTTLALSPSDLLGIYDEIRRRHE